MKFKLTKLLTIVVFTIPLAFLLIGNIACTNINQTKLRYERDSQFATAEKGPNKETVTVVVKMPKNIKSSSVHLAIDEDQETEKAKTNEPEGGGIVLTVNGLEAVVDAAVAKVIAERDANVTGKIGEAARTALEAIPKP